jgi:hypothetical protein
MTKPITLERTLETSFVAIGEAEQLDDRFRAFREYNGRINYLDQQGRLTLDAVRDLTEEWGSENYHIDYMAGRVLGEKHEGQALYNPGYSAVIVDEYGKVKGAGEDPRQFPEVLKYGSGLKFALLKVGQEKLAVEATGWSTVNIGSYEVVNQALTGKPLDEVPYGGRHHIGGAAALDFVGPKRDRLRLFAGVSGVVATEAFFDMARNYPNGLREYLVAIMDEAQADPAILGGFKGNMFAGELDSGLGSFMLHIATGYDPYTHPSGRGVVNHFTPMIVHGIVRAHEDGINVH